MLHFAQLKKKQKILKKKIKWQNQPLIIKKNQIKNQTQKYYCKIIIKIQLMNKEKIDLKLSCKVKMNKNQS